MTVAEFLALARRSGVERLDAQLLLSHAFDRPRSWLLAHDDALLPEAGRAALVDQLQRRAAGEPLAYLLGEKEFHGLTLSVAPAVLIPRPETETLVDWALERLAASPGASVLDLGTGSGAIALAIRHACPDARVAALDASADALAVARQNGERHALPVEWLLSDWWSAVGDRRFDVIVSNPPYIAEGDPHLPALRHEPLSALTAGADGLDDLRRLVTGAGAHLAPDGWLLLEHGYDQADAVAALLRGADFESIELRRDLAGRPRCTGGRRGASRH